MTERWDGAALIVLAAGAGRRLGGAAKALLPIGGAGETFLARIAATARAAGVARGVVVVAPPYGGAVAEEARRVGLEVIENAEPERGMSSSVELGFAWALRQGAASEEAPSAEGAAAGAVELALLWPCDHPAVQVETVRQLLGEAREAEAEADEDTDPVAAILPAVGGRGGHPALITRGLFAELARCSIAPEGARSILRVARVRRLAVEDVGCVADVDDPAAARAVAAEGV